MDLSKELLNNILPHTFSIKIPFLNINVPLSDTVVTTWVIMAILIIGSIWLTRNMKLIPSKKQNFIEAVVGAINSFCKDILGHNWKHFAPYLGTVFIFLAAANIISLFNIFPDWDQLYKTTHWSFLHYLPSIHVRPPTKDINVPACLATFSIIIVIGASIRFKRVSGWLRSFIQPSPIMLPFKVMEYFIRPLSLSLRLFGNIMGAFIMMELIYLAFPAFIPAFLSGYFDLFDGILQAFVFVFLTSLYIFEAIE